MRRLDLWHSPLPLRTNNREWYGRGSKRHWRNRRRQGRNSPTAQGAPEAEKSSKQEFEKKRMELREEKLGRPRTAIAVRAPGRAGSLGVGAKPDEIIARAKELLRWLEE